MTALTLRVIRPAKDEVERVFLSLIPFYAEVGRGEMNVAKAMRTITGTAANGFAVVVENEAGAIIGSMGLEVQEMWYSDDRQLADVWFHVKHGHRDGRAADLMLECARGIAAAVPCDVVFTLAPGKRARGPRGRIQSIGATLGYTVGRTLHIHTPEQEG